MQIAWSARKLDIDDADILQPKNCRLPGERPSTKAAAQQKVGDFIDGIDATQMRDGSHLREIATGARELSDADARLRAAVRAAREAGDSWTAIVLVLGTSKQNAHRKRFCG